jgi:hypothetical protein
MAKNVFTADVASTSASTALTVGALRSGGIEG